MRDIPITTDTIRLGQFLKLADLVEVGSDVKLLLEDGAVTVNGEAESRRGRTLTRGDVVSVDGADLRVAGRPGGQARG
jgi:ribosome-associated protein